MGDDCWRLGIDPAELRASTTAFRERAKDVRHLVEDLPAPALKQVRELLLAGDGERQRVLDYLDGLLKTGK